MNLKDYRKKRNFNSTTEPLERKKDNRRHKNLFVIQKHKATQLHYDFRIEIDHVLVSWAVPKGPSTDPKEKNLAIRTEDHPLEYANFEGIIPEDQYGGGTVIVWDKGNYENQADVNMSEALREGKIKIWLKGKKIQGGYHLIRIKNTKKNQEKWLLMKSKDNEADARRNPTTTQPESVISNMTIEQIEKNDEKNNK